MRFVPSRLVLFAMAWIGLASVGLATADDTPADKTKAGPAQPKIQRVEGVIIQVKPFSIGATGATDVAEEPVQESGLMPPRYRLTLNTAIPWNDYVRDEAVNPEKVAKTDQSAPKTQESVAIEGQPDAEPTKQVVDITPETKIELRYRSSTDEADDGAATIEAAEAAPGDPAAANGDKPTPNSPKPKKLEASGLRIGQYVIVEYHESTAQIPATRIIVLKPIGGANVSAKDDEEVQPPTRKSP